MAKHKYHFNTKTLKFEKARVTIKERSLKVLSFLFTTLAFASLVIFLAYNFLESPMEKMQRRELANMKTQYKILNTRLDQLLLVMQDMQERDDNIYRVIFEQEPIPSSIRKAGFGGIDRYANLRGLKNSELIISTSEKLDVIANQMYVQSKSFDVVFELAKNKEKMLASLPAIQPVRNKDLRRIGSYFGYRTDPFYKIQKFHEGLDFSAPVGTEVYATGDGVVVAVERSRIGYGNHVLIDHGYSYQTLYAHLSNFEVRRGEKVKRGQVIGYIGNTGKSTSPHLHYEVHRNGRPIDPIHFLFNDITADQYEMLIELSARPGQSMD